MKRGLRTITVLFLLATSGLIAIAACSNQGEGERCDVLNGNNDCNTSDGLICYRAADLNNSPLSDRCCPSNRAEATHPVCVTPRSVGETDAAAPADTGPPPATPDATTSDAGDAATADGSNGNDGGDGG